MKKNYIKPEIGLEDIDADVNLMETSDPDTKRDTETPQDKIDYGGNSSGGGGSRSKDATGFTSWDAWDDDDEF